MPEILRLQNSTAQHDLRNDLKHWDKSGMYDDKQINAIESSNKHTLSEPTSIPSPFARIALAKTAFAEVAQHGENALKSYQKIVSDCLDVAEIFFTFDKWQDRIEILKWDRDVDLKELEPGHLQVYKTLDTFLKTDAQAYNFDKMKCIYILKHRATGDMIGATSPCTLFFSSANEFEGEIILSENHKAFDGVFPLHKRSRDFLKYIYMWIKVNDENRMINGKARSVFHEFIQYLNKQKSMTGKFEEISALQEQASAAGIEQNYGSFPPGMAIEILGKPYHKQITGMEPIESDFEIQTFLFAGAIKPLVLPLEGGNGSGYENWKLTPTTKWAAFKAPVKYAEPMYNRRRLPDGAYYPCLTVSDFLEDAIIKIPYKINSDSFFEAGGEHYLLPLKDLFFEFFSVEDLMKNKMIELKTSGRTLKVTLRIPVKGDKFIEYSRHYMESGGNTDRDNTGSVKESDFAYALFPNVGFDSGIEFDADMDACYRFILISKYEDSDNYKVMYHTPSGLTEPDVSVRNTNDTRYHKCKCYSIEHSQFDYMRIRHKHYSGVVIPKLLNCGGTNQYTFAVDIGTTNTHIEYSVNGEPGSIKSFEISKKQIHRVADIVGDDYKVILDNEFIPEYTDSEFKFPMRTALSYSDRTNWKIGAAPFTVANAAVLYEKQLELAYNRIATELKWSDDDSNKNMLKCYIESLCFILRNKVIIENGNLEETKIIWFYPVSMTIDRFNNFEKIWKSAYGKYFGNKETNIIPVTESVAPYECYKRSGNTGIMASIDIGGGTTDIVIGTDSQADAITSFRFAANSVFGDGYNETGLVKNGIIRQFIGSIKEKLEDKENGLGNDRAFLELFDKLSGKNSADIASFLFSLENNRKIKEKGNALAESVDFSKILRNNNSQTIVFIFFYTAIIYHLAHLMKARKTGLPRHITFSGNGSKIIRILPLDDGTLTELTKFIFLKIYNSSPGGLETIQDPNPKEATNKGDLNCGPDGLETIQDPNPKEATCKGDLYYSPDGLDIIHDPNPKEATCKGGLLSQEAEPYSSIHSKKIVLKSSEKCSLISSETYKDINTEAHIDQVVRETETFIKFVLDDTVLFLSEKGLPINKDSHEIAKNICFKDLKQYVKNGLLRKSKETMDTKIIEETLFFYPLHGMLNALSNEICKQNLKK
jgi:hypothetical protein